MITQKIKIDAPIIPGQAAGNLRLYTKLIDIQDMVLGLENMVFTSGWDKESLYRLESPFEAVYSFGEGAVRMAVDVRNGKVFKIIVSEGYRGLLLGKIKVGMLVREAMALEPELYYHEPEEIIRHRSYPGVGIEVGETDPDPQSVPDMTIEHISVFIVEIDRSDGQRGLW